MKDLDKNMIEINHLISLLLSDKYPLDTVAFAVMEHIVDFDDISVIANCPPSVIEALGVIKEAVERTGEYKIYSGVGCADHSALAKAFASIIRENKIDLSGGCGSI